MTTRARLMIVAARTVGVVTSALAIYALAMAAFYPSRLPYSVPGIDWGRIDTTGMVSIVVSLACFIVTRLAALGARASLRRRAAELLRLIAIYAGVGWGYLALGTLTHPWSRYIAATHLASYPTEDQLSRLFLVVGIIALAGTFWLRLPGRAQLDGQQNGEALPPDLVTRARAIAEAAHAGQVDGAGQPYLDHAARVAGAVAGDDRAVATGWLHDVLEDSPWTAGQLVDAGIPLDVVAAVVALTHEPGEADEVYWARVRANPLALRVKLDGDLADNTDPARLARLDQATRERLEDKYRRARHALEA